ncbi:H-NS histone family protein [Sansalvadorimonas verongulae]|uniref:H-NS histone family protein n=1 Tax=Sansalvadorimonas verongulae TaxID=2172824 RepID=UPI0012BBDE9B|nr:H-NS histone family protein [Sansalvadorimonas verongulae]MTI13723.1 H-NS histone family protein [Sansalvadorimonas verongulae]
MNMFEEIMHRLSSKTRMRGLFKDVHFEDMERIIDRMNSLLEEKRAAYEEDQAKNKEKEESIEQIRKILEEKGLSLADLGATEEVATKKRRNINKYTFEYVTKAGDTVQWYGSTTGRLPKDFQAYLDETGKKRLDCVVKQEDEE